MNRDKRSAFVLFLTNGFFLDSETCKACIEFLEKRFLPIVFYNKSGLTPNCFGNNSTGMEYGMYFLQTDGEFDVEVKCEKPVIAKFSGETFGNEILKFINISEEQHIFSIMITKSDCMVVCRVHLTFQIIILEHFGCIHIETYFTVNVNEKGCLHKVVQET